ncbi:hypothetical protein, partial [Infirmifilum sp.]|uniref:hypothetical protein n=1 Tax=Infirmifilum sp. TaxID=2856575 RepID=UPI003D0D5E6C
RREESVADMGAPLLRNAKKVSEAAEATPTRVVPLQLAETQIVDVEALEKEVRTLVEEAGKYRQFLRKLDEAREGGRISEKAYEELKKEYSEKLIEIENRIKELEKRIASRG